MGLFATRIIQLKIEKDAVAGSPDEDGGDHDPVAAY